MQRLARALSEKHCQACVGVVQLLVLRLFADHAGLVAAAADNAAGPVTAFAQFDAADRLDYYMECYVTKQME